MSIKIQTPEWIKSSTIYQIFPDRFNKSENVKVEGIFEPWDKNETPHGFKGGNLLGIVEKLDYLQDLGINTIYLNPIFKSCANHRYHTYDYLEVDPILGGNKAFKELLTIAHKKNIKIIIDGVFNHCSRGFFQFNHILENEKSSPYVDWFTIYNYPLKAYNLSKNEKPNYACWWNLPELPKFNTNNQEVRNFIFNTARYWIDFGIDGWRLDVPYEINDDSFWQEYRDVCKKANPDCYIVGEIWGNAQRWLKGDQFDGVMNYNLAFECINYYAGDKAKVTHLYDGKKTFPINASTFKKNINNLLSVYDWEITKSQMNICTTHDTDRMLNTYGHDQKIMKLAIVFTMFFPGAQNIYYGEEIGLSGILNNGTRQCMPWSESLWNKELLEFYVSCIELKKSNSLFCSGLFSFIEDTVQEDVLIYKRHSTENQNNAFVITNKSDQTQNLSLKTNDDKTYTILLSSDKNMKNKSIDIKNFKIAPFGYLIVGNK